MHCVALTPDGNLTLVDDVGSPTKSGKQFITMRRLLGENDHDEEEK